MLGRTKPVTVTAFGKNMKLASPDSSPSQGEVHLDTSLGVDAVVPGMGEKTGRRVLCHPDLGFHLGLGRVVNEVGRVDEDTEVWTAGKIVGSVHPFIGSLGMVC